jgi:plasmid stabilization system protein ParE
VILARAVRFTLLAAGHIRSVERWWRDNRQSAPNAVREELDRVLPLISAQPRIGPPARNIKLPDVRRVYLPRIKYDLYYRLVEGENILEVLALWHARRGEAPPI